MPWHKKYRSLRAKYVAMKHFCDGMNDISQSLFLFPHVAGHHAVFFLKAFGEVAGGSKADSVGHFRDTLVGGEQQLIGAIQTGGAQKLDGRRACDGLHFAIQLYTAQIHVGCEIFDTYVAAATGAGCTTDRGTATSCRSAASFTTTSLSAKAS